MVSIKSCLVFFKKAIYTLKTGTTSLLEHRIVCEAELQERRKRERERERGKKKERRKERGRESVCRHAASGPGRFSQGASAR
jgi:hypothetical protein